MSEEKQKHRLFKVAKELNTRSQLLVDHLVAKGYHISNTPNEKLSEEMYAILLKEFASKRDQKPNNWDENEIGTVTNVEVSSRLAGLRVKGKIDLDALSGKKPKPVTDPEKMLATDSEPKLEEPVTTAPKNQAFQPDLFISYKRDPASMKVVQALKTFIRETFPSVKVLSDEEELKNRDSIKAYMDRLTKGDFIIFVLSAGFLESPWCMYELALTADFPEYEDRVFQIRFPGLQIRSAIDVAKITKRWQDKWKELRDLLEEIAAENADHLADELKEDLRIASEIVKGSGKALSHMRGTIGFEVNADNELDYEKLEEDLMQWFMLRADALGRIEMVMQKARRQFERSINEAFDQGVL